MRFPFESFEFLVGSQVGLFVPFQIIRLIGAVVAAFMVTPVHPGSLVGRQVDLFVFFQIIRLVGAVVAAFIVTLVHLGFRVSRQVGLFVG